MGTVRMGMPGIDGGKGPLDHGPRGDGRSVCTDGRLYVVVTTGTDDSSITRSAPLGTNEQYAAAWLAADTEVCCYTPSFTNAVTACDEYAEAWVAMREGVRRTEDLFAECDQANPDDPLPCAPGHYLRRSPDSLCETIHIYYSPPAPLPATPARLVRTFIVCPCNKWVDDFMEERTPAVCMLDASDRAGEAYYNENVGEMGPPLSPSAGSAAK